MKQTIKYIPKFYTTIGYSNAWDINDGLLGFMTPYGTDAAFQKRKDTADYWASRKICYIRNTEGNIQLDANRNYITEPDIPSRIIDNIPQAGFRICDMRRRSTTSNVVWRVAEPNGFEVEISSQNLNSIIQEMGIMANGVIPGNCIWGRLGNNNVLIPDMTEDYMIMEALYRKAHNAS